MTTLTVFLADLPKKITYPAWIRQPLQDLFKEVIASKHNKTNFDKAVVRYTSVSPPLAAHDLLVYFVNDFDDSVVRKLAGMTRDQAQKEKDRNGWTVTRSAAHGHGSEVYLQSLIHNPRGGGLGIAKMCFHELLHNVTKLNNKGLHESPGVRLGKGEIEPDWTLSEADIKLMLQHLGGTRRQWTGGFSYYHDPARDIW